MPLRDALRLPLRSAAFVGLTFSMYGGLEADIALHGRAADRLALLSKWVERYGRSLLRLYGVEVAARGPFLGEGRRHPGRDARGVGRVFVMNHRSGLDVPVTLAFVDATIVSRADLARWPVIGMAARRAGTLFVDRTSRHSGAAVVSTMCAALRAGRGVMVYPEGTTYEGDEVRPFRPGAFSAALRTGAEIIPLGIAYGGGASSFGDESFPEHMMRVSRARRTEVALVAGDPLPPASSIEATRDAAWAAVQTLVRQARGVLTGSRRT
jgi:1-acyl-sn-glycerol-3-phosphate acyltransferase